MKFTQKNVDRLPVGRQRLIQEQGTPLAVKIGMRGNAYLVRVKIDGKWTYRKLGDTTSMPLVEARRKAIELAADASRGRLSAIPGEATTLAQWAERHIASLTNPRTRQFYEWHKHHLLGRPEKPTALADMPLCEIDHWAIDRLLGGLTGQVRYKTQVWLGTLFNRALKQGVIETNPMDRLEKTKRPKRAPVEIFRPSEAEALLAAVGGDRYEAVYILGMATGLRPNEIFGLFLEDIDTERSLLKVRRGMHEISGKQKAKPEIGMLKYSSYRDIEVPAGVVTVLLLHAEERKRCRRYPGLIFTDTAGGPIRSRNFNKREFRGALQRAAIKGPYSMYTMRHWRASTWLEQGVPMNVVSYLLGHSSIQITIDTYAHVTSAGRKQAATASAKMFTLGAQHEMVDVGGGVSVSKNIFDEAVAKAKGDVMKAVKALRKNYAEE